MSARTISTKAMFRLPLVNDESGPLPMRPSTRGDCIDAERPCPWVGCRHNAYLDVNPKTGSITFTFPGVEPEDVPAEHSCTLDIADAGGVKLETVGEVLNIVRERARQIEASAISDLHKRAFDNRRVASLLQEYAIDPDPNRPPTNNGHSRRFRESPEPDEEAESDLEATGTISNVSFFADDDDAVCDTVWTMLTKLWRIRSKGSLAISRYLARVRLEKEGKR